MPAGAKRRQEIVPGGGHGGRTGTAVSVLHVARCISADVVVIGSAAFGASAAYIWRAAVFVWPCSSAPPAGLADLAASPPAVEPGRSTPALTRWPARRAKLATFTAVPASRCGSRRAAPSRSPDGDGRRAARARGRAWRRRRRADRLHLRRRGAPPAADSRRARHGGHHVEPTDATSSRPSCRGFTAGPPRRLGAVLLRTPRQRAFRPGRAAWKACERRAAPSPRACRGAVVRWHGSSPARSSADRCPSCRAPQLLTRSRWPGSAPSSDRPRDRRQLLRAPDDARAHARWVRVRSSSAGRREPDRTSPHCRSTSGAVAARAQRARAVPDLQEPSIRVAEHAADFTMTIDALSRGPAARRAGAWVMSGCCVGGLSASPALGEAMAEWLIDVARRRSTPRYLPARFAGATSTTPICASAAGSPTRRTTA